MTNPILASLLLATLAVQVRTPSFPHLRPVSAGLFHGWSHLTREPRAWHYTGHETVRDHQELSILYEHCHESFQHGKGDYHNVRYVWAVISSFKILCSTADESLCSGAKAVSKFFSKVVIIVNILVNRTYKPKFSCSRSCRCVCEVWSPGLGTRTCWEWDGPEGGMVNWTLSNDPSLPLLRSLG